MKKYVLLLVLSITQCVHAEPLSFMTFNIRYGTADDGENSWKYRKDHVVDTIQFSAPDALAIQEALLGQLDFIQERLPRYKKIGVHRNGNTEGEFSGLLIDTRRLEILDEGQIWLSETPDEISKGWDAALNRTATWVIVRRAGTSSPAFLLVGTHFDHQGTEVRLESAKLITEKISEFCKDKQLPVAIMGDFNCTLGSPPMNVFNSAGYSPMVLSAIGDGTFHGFSGKTDGPRIDFILLNNAWETISVEILRPRREGKSASDHDPVLAKVVTTSPTGTIGIPRSTKHTVKPSKPSFVFQFIPDELVEEVSKIEQVIISRADTEPDYHELPYVFASFKYPFSLLELAGDLTDQLHTFHNRPQDIKDFAALVLDPQSVLQPQKKIARPTTAQIFEFLAIPNDTFYIEQEQLQSALEVINYSKQVDFDAIVNTIQVQPMVFKQPFFGKAMPPGVTGTVLAGQMGPDGWMVVGGAGPNTYDMTQVAVVFDMGGDDTYFANDIVIGNRKVTDLQGDDIYTGTASQGPAAGLFGTWIIDDYAGDDQYGTVGGTFSTGAAAFGVGMIIDRGGDDVYMGTQWSIGAAVYGVGVVMDFGSGDDQYLGEFLTIGVGGPRGFGFVFDEAGDDYYLADGPKPSVYGTPDVFCAYSQGMGFGYRKYAAGGIGILCDVSGDDRYQAGEFSQGGAYYHGLGILRDFSGDDDFHGNRYAQGFGVHQAFGVLIDDAGDDTYWAMTAADQGSAWDIAAGALLDKSGDDSYTANGMTQGSAAMQGIAYLIDLDGEDSYNGLSPAQGESGSNSYHWEATHAFSFSLLLDLGGDKDTYSLERTNNMTTETQRNPKPAGSGIGIFVDK